jgi:hypothetical protein
MKEDHLALPFSTNVLGVDVVVEKVDMTRMARLWRFAVATKPGRRSESSICRCERQRPAVRNGSQRTTTGAGDSE